MIRPAILAPLCLLVAFTGCMTQDLNTDYGRRGGRARTSVNGTAVLAEMFRQRGHKVTSWSRLSPRLERSKVIVWAPNSFELPSASEIDFLENWLASAWDRTVVYVGRDYDAAIDYWQLLAERSQGESFLKNRRQLARAQSDHALLRSYTGKALDCKWFSMESQFGFVPVTPEGPWTANVDIEKTRLVVAGRMKTKSINGRQVTLLDSEEGPLIVQRKGVNWPHNSKLILVTNGSSLLNLPLVNHEHRKIAGKLIDVCGSPGRVTFLESGPGGLPVSDEDPHAHTGFEAFTVWPISSILLHLTIAGILYCAMVYPIFGRPRDVADDTPSEFGKHIRATAELLSFINDREAAVAQVQHYRQLTTDTVAPKNPQPAGNPFQTNTETDSA